MKVGHLTQTEVSVVVSFQVISFRRAYFQAFRIEERAEAQGKTSSKQLTGQLGLTSEAVDNKGNGRRLEVLKELVPAADTVNDERHIELFCQLHLLHEEFCLERNTFVAALVQATFADSPDLRMRRQ